MTSASPVVRATTPTPAPLSVREIRDKGKDSGKDLLSIPWLTSDQPTDREKVKDKGINNNKAKDKGTSKEKDKDKVWDSDSDKEPSSIPWLTSDQPSEIDKDKGKDNANVTTGNKAPAPAAAPVVVTHQPISPKKRSSFFSQEPGLVAGGSPGKRSMAVERARQQTDLDAVTPFVPLAHDNYNDNNATKALPRRPSPAPGQGPVPDSARSTATANPTPRPGPPPPRPLGIHPNATMPDSARSNVGGAGAPSRPMPPPDSARSAMSTVPGPPNSNPTPRPGPPPPRPQGVNPNATMPDSARSTATANPYPTPRPAPPPPRPLGVTPNANATTGVNRPYALGGKPLTISTTRSMDSNDDDDYCDNDNDYKGGAGSVQGSTQSTRVTPKVNSEIAEIKVQSILHDYHYLCYVFNYFYSFAFFNRFMSV